MNPIEYQLTQQADPLLFNLSPIGYASLLLCGLWLLGLLLALRSYLNWRAKEEAEIKQLDEVWL